MLISNPITEKEILETYASSVMEDAKSAAMNLNRLINAHMRNDSTSCEAIILIHQNKDTDIGTLNRAYDVKGLLVDDYLSHMPYEYKIKVLPKQWFKKCVRIKINLDWSKVLLKRGTNGQQN